MRNFNPISIKAAKQKNPLVLAYLGDTVYDLFTRSYEVLRGDLHVNELNRKVIGHVNAAAQAAAVDKLTLLEDEKEVFRRARNARAGTMPKNMSAADYHAATGIEAVIGFLYLTGNDERLNELFERILQDE